MTTRKRFSTWNLVLACGLGVVAGTLLSGPHPQVALAKTAAPAQTVDDGKLRIIIFGAHPDDAEYRGAGVAMKWARMGHHVKLVSATAQPVCAIEAGAVRTIFFAETKQVPAEFVFERNALVKSSSGKITRAESAFKKVKHREESLWLRHRFGGGSGNHARRLLHTRKGKVS